MSGHMLMGRLGMPPAAPPAAPAAAAERAAAAAALPAVVGTENTGGMPGKIPLGEF